MRSFRHFPLCFFSPLLASAQTPVVSLQEMAKNPASPKPHSAPWTNITSSKPSPGVSRSLIATMTASSTSWSSTIPPSSKPNTAACPSVTLYHQGEKLKIHRYHRKSRPHAQRLGHGHPPSLITTMTACADIYVTGYGGKRPLPQSRQLQI